MGFGDISRVTSLMAGEDLDGLLVVSPENYAYVAGVSGHPGAMWRRVGPVAALVTRDGDLTFIVPDTQEGGVRRANPDANILTHTLWIERVDADPSRGGSAEDVIARATEGRSVDRPETYDRARTFQLLREAVGDAGLLGKRLGIELEFAPAVDIEDLREQLGDTELVNSSPLLQEIRVIKTQQEIDLLRRGNELTELGMMASLEGFNDQTVGLDVYTKYSEAIYRAVREQRVFGFESARTTVHLGPHLWGTGDPLRTAQPGDLIQFDSGVQIRGYQSDIGRTFAFRQASDIQLRVQEALLAGFAAGMAELRPGRTYSDVFHATQNAVRAAGFPSYTRGHFGHSIGSEIFPEEWPWISATEQRVLEPGMVVAFEVPYYINGIGGFQNEDNILITEDGNESFNTLPMELTVIGT